MGLTVIGGEIGQEKPGLRQELKIRTAEYIQCPRVYLSACKSMNLPMLKFNKSKYLEMKHRYSGHVLGNC